MLISAIILVSVLVIFTLGKSPVFRVDRAGAAIIGATLVIVSKVLTFDQATRVVDYRTIVLLFSMMLISSYMNIIGLFELMGRYVMGKIKTGQGLLIMVIIVSGVLSAFLINDIVCLLFTPVVLTICRRAKIFPTPYLLAVALASNIGSAATLIGNPQNILIGSLARLPFAWYLLLALPITFVGLILTYFVLLKAYAQDLRHTLSYPEMEEKAKPIPRILLLKGIVVITGVLLGFILGFEPVLVASLGAALLLITRRLKPNKVYAGIDFNLLVIFIGLFIIVGGVEQSGLFEQFLGHLNGISLPMFTVLTVILSNIVSNVPAMMLLKFFIPMDNSAIWWANMALFSTLAGNLTITGSIANLIVAELAKKGGVTIRFGDYLRVGLPITIALVLIGLGYFKLVFGI